MCVPEIFIRPDGKGFIVRKGGVDWAMYPKMIGEDHHIEWAAVAYDYIPGHNAVGMGDTIHDAINMGETQITW